MIDIVADMPLGRNWTLSDDLETVRLQLPPLPIDGMPEPLRVHLEFDAEMVDEILQRLTVLRAQMQPSPLIVCAVVGLSPSLPAAGPRSSLRVPIEGRLTAARQAGPYARPPRG